MDPFSLSTLLETYQIGSHMRKEPSLLATVKRLPNGVPSQIFVGSPTSSKVSAKEADMDLTRAYLSENNKSIFVHSPYLINLCTAVDTENNNWHLELLKRNLTIANRCGFLGVVVHVGKSTKQPIATALATMRSNLLSVLDSASERCPLLLETPAGQGTELLTRPSDFLKFVQDIGDSRLKVCVDTCHVFAAGHDPLALLESAYADTDIIRLVHYNDSKGSCGSCKDLHALVGTGHIGFEKMRKIAEICHAKGVPMVIE